MWNLPLNELKSHLQSPALLILHLLWLQLFSVPESADHMLEDTQIIKLLLLTLFQVTGNYNLCLLPKNLTQAWSNRGRAVSASHRPHITATLTTLQQCNLCQMANPTKGLFKQDQCFLLGLEKQKGLNEPQTRGQAAVVGLELCQSWSHVAAYRTPRRLSVLSFVLSQTQTAFALHLYCREPWTPFLLSTSSFLSHCCYTVKLK